MSEKINHWCVVCGKGYHSCDSCAKIKSFTPWRSLTDSIEHFKIFSILKDFNNKLISKEEARKLLSNIDLSDKDSFKDSAKNVLNEIYKEDTVVEHKKIRKRNFVSEDNKDESEISIVEMTETEIKNTTTEE